MVPAKIAWLHGLGFRDGVCGLRAIDRVSNVLPDLLLLEFAKFCQGGHGVGPVGDVEAGPVFGFAEGETHLLIEIVNGLCQRIENLRVCPRSVGRVEGIAFFSRRFMNRSKG